MRYLTTSANAALLAETGKMLRSMWCTAGFLHAADKTVSREGRIMPLKDGQAAEVFTFDPINVTCEAGGITRYFKKLAHDPQQVMLSSNQRRAPAYVSGWYTNPPFEPGQTHPGKRHQGRPRSP